MAANEDKKLIYYIQFLSYISDRGVVGTKIICLTNQTLAMKGLINQVNIILLCLLKNLIYTKTKKS